MDWIVARQFRMDACDFMFSARKRANHLGVNPGNWFCSRPNWVSNIVVTPSPHLSILRIDEVAGTTRNRDSYGLVRRAIVRITIGACCNELA